MVNCDICIQHATSDCLARVRIKGTSAVCYRQLLGLRS